MLKFLLISLGVILLLCAVYFLIRGVGALMAAPFDAIERRKDRVRLEIREAEDAKYNVQADAFKAFCDDVRALDQCELAEFWDALDHVPAWHATETIWGKSGQAKLVREFDDKRLFLCRAREKYELIHSDATSTVRATIGTGGSILCFRGKRDWGYGWSIFRCAPEEYAKRNAEIEEIERAKVEKAKIERRIRLGLPPPHGQSSGPDDHEKH